MADSKNTQTAHAGLPEKEWFTLEEVATRWGCTVDDLLHYGITERLEICADFCDATVQMGDFGENDEWNAFSEFQIEGLLEISAEDLKRISKNPNTQTKPKWLWIIHEESGHRGIRRYKGLLRVSIDENGNPLIDGVSARNLVIVGEELNAFEKHYRIGACAGTMPDLREPDKLDPRKEKTYLQIIRALLAEANIPDEPYKAAAVLQAAAAKSGLILPSKPDTIAEKLKSARNLSD